jgi:hypothetical protein
MTDTTVQVPDYVTFDAHRSIGDIAVITTELLAEAAAAGLALPRYLSINDHELSLQFGGHPDIWDVLASWADHYGHRKDILIRLRDTDEGSRVHATFTFTHHGVTVELYSNFLAGKEN